MHGMFTESRGDDTLELDVNDFDMSVFDLLAEGRLKLVYTEIQLLLKVILVLFKHRIRSISSNNGARKKWVQNCSEESSAFAEEITVSQRNDSAAGLSRRSKETEYVEEIPNKHSNCISGL